MLLRRHREASVKAPTPIKEVELVDDPGNTDPGQIDPGNTDPGDTDPGNTDPGQDGADDDYAINYDELSYDELQEIAKKRGIPANVKKAELIEALKASE